MSGTIAAIAIGGSAVLGAAATVYGANKAADATTAASNAAISEQQQALAQQQAIAAPYVAQGQQGIATYNALTSATPGQAQQTLQNTPGYQATYTTGVEAAERAAAASGLNLSGNQIQGVESFGAQLGDQTYQQAINNALGQETIGQSAASGVSANIGQTASTIGNIGINQGNTNASITSNEVAGLTRAAGTAGNQFLTYNALQGLNNPAGTATPTYNPALVGSNFDGSAGAAAPVYTAPIAGYS